MTARGHSVYVLLFAALSVAVIFYPLLPLQFQAGQIAQPDLLFALASAWAVRRPETMPLLLLAPVLLLSDFVLGRPVGLWALLSLLAIEALAAQRGAAEPRPFVLEWASFAMVLGIALLVEGLVLRMALVARPPFSTTVEVFIITAFAYPVVAFVLRTVFYVRAPKPVERSRRLGRVG